MDAKYVGQKLPEAIRNIAWKESYADGCYAEDSFGNEWKRDDTTYSAILESRSREAVYLRVELEVSDEQVLTAMYVEANGSYGPSHGRPELLELDQAEQGQIDEFLTLLFDEAKSRGSLRN